MTEPEGLQAERTILAYRRTELALVVVAMLIGRDAVVHAKSPAIAVVAIGAAAFAVVFTRLRQHRLHEMDTDADSRTVVAVVTAAAVMQLAALLAL